MKVKLLGCAAIALEVLYYYEPAHCGTLLKFFKGDDKKENKLEQTEEEEGEEEESSDEEENESSGGGKSVSAITSKSDSKESVGSEQGPKAKPKEPATVATSSVAPSALQSTGKNVAPVVPEKPKKEIKGDPIVAKVGRIKEFHRSDVLKILKSLPPQLTKGIPHDRLFQMCLDQLISSCLMVEQAKKAGLEKTKEFIETLEATKNDLLARQFLVKEIMPKAENESVLKARYAKYVVDFKSIKETQVFHIMVTTEKEAEEVISKLDKGEDFKRLAKEKSIAPSKEKGGEEGYIALSILPSPIKETLEKLGKNGYTKKPLSAGGSWHVFKLGDTRDSTHQSYEEIKDSLKQVIVQEEIMKLIARLMKQFNVVKFNEDGSAMAQQQPATQHNGGVTVPNEVARLNPQVPAPRQTN